MDNNSIKPHWIAIRVDESGYCEKEFLERCGGKLYAIYLYNENEVTHCCELTPSYCLNLVEYIPETLPENEEDLERLQDELRDCLAKSEPISYNWCSGIDRFSPESKKGFQVSDNLEADDIDGVLEAYLANPICW